MDRIYFKVNDVQCSVGSEVSSEDTLLDFIRDHLELRGTKYMCREGGCGACIVTASTGPASKPFAVNSCLVSVTSCQGWEITTVEKVGNRLQGYHVIQETLADHNGTQCGYCTPGWVMSMYSLLQSNSDLTMLDIEKSFGSNICRCTGYRPILDAFKQFAKDAPKPVIIPDIEDTERCNKNCKDCKKSCKHDENDWCFLNKEDLTYLQSIKIDLKDGKLWFRVTNLENAFEILKKIGANSYMLVAGNTAKGAYPIDEYPKVLIDISSVPELKVLEKDQNLIIGAGTTLSRFLEICKEESENKDFSYLVKFYEHIQLVAHIPVRNLGTIAGNLITKHRHNEFPSDIFLLLETVGAQLIIVNSKYEKSTVTMQDFLKLDMKHKIILNILLPPLSSEYKVITFKIMSRAQNVKATVNAGFLYKLKENNEVLECRIVFGNLSPSFVRATATESFLIGKSLFKNKTLRSAISTLQEELVVTEMPPEASAKYRKQLALALFYKGLLTICPPNVIDPRYRSGSSNLRASRLVSQARQTFETDKSLWPLNQPVQKLEALIQCSGEAPFTDDIPKLPQEVFAAFVLSTVAKGDIVTIDSKNAVKYPGVIAFYSSKDIPGTNLFYAGDKNIDLTSPNEELFCDGKVKFYNQPIGVIVAETRIVAEKAAKMVNVQYANVVKPIIDLNRARKNENRVKLYKADIGKKSGINVKTVIKGNVTFYGQYHFTMETIVCVSQPTDMGIEIYASTQWSDSILEILLHVLKIDGNRIDVYTRRVGGAFGLKVSRTSQMAIAGGLVSYKLNRPCRFITPLTTLTRAVGKRLPCTSDYEVGVDDLGVIQYISQKHYDDYGYTFSENHLSFLSLEMYFNCYNNSRWNYSVFCVTTDTPKNTWCRAPGSLTSIAIAETIMERISYELSLDPITVRLANLDTDSAELTKIIQNLKEISNYSERKAKTKKFNTENKWKKRGLRCSFLKWKSLDPLYLDVNLSVLQADGSVFIAHGGIEMGQGINTKAAQVCAYLLKIPLSKVKIKGNSTILTPNVAPTVGSLTSQNVCLGVKRCCEELLKRLEPTRKKNPNLKWKDLIKQAVVNDVQLQVHGSVGSKDIQNYNIFGAAIAEVEIDILTGESQVLRVDLIQDAGLSVNPELDIGQVEGAFIMGLGFWTSEHLVYNMDTGELLTDRTWNYEVPQARDIPQDFRVSLRKKSYSLPKYLGAKATGEPPMCLSIVVPLALREALVSARLESGIPSNRWFDIDGPYTLEKICLAAATKIEDFKYF